MSQVEIGEADFLSGLVERAQAGEDVVLSRRGQTVARIVAVVDRDVAAPAVGRRQLGRLAGKWTVPDDFDAPLPDDVLALFHDGPLFPDEPTPTNGTS